ncbi:DeoR family transcriptional regulator [Terrilactibacillus sp. BCM23-1]|uniref:DeoR family transcriptional regulator n=1 Tax=Terrilactibacillus tamarindi TaxID=2599694 RepID=A0A6N8CQE5_9BACI|nr:DeoR/GlpR family DNA-binding transcription regulator [Terrilactibacillus tamarindi]MTT31880.1 DeoR family transcriptional regulator [Terrilactibacillus tamarindi]
MYQEERLLKILEQLNEQQSMSVNEICERFHVSRDTARRDIVKLVEKGAVIRTHGGVSLPKLNETLLAYRERVHTYSKEKMRIGAKANTLIKENQTCFFDVSTTVSYLAERLKHKVNVFTHSLDIAEILSNQDPISLFLLGGKFNVNNRFFFDMESIQQVLNINFDLAFLGAAAIMDDGVFFEDKEDAYMKQTITKRASRNVVLADYKKFKLTSYYKGIDWQDIDVIITDKMPPKVFVNKIQDVGIDLIIAE